MEDEKTYEEEFIRKYMQNMENISYANRHYIRNLVADLVQACIDDGIYVKDIIREIRYQYRYYKKYPNGLYDPENR